MSDALRQQRDHSDLLAVSAIEALQRETRRCEQEIARREAAEQRVREMEAVLRVFADEDNWATIDYRHYEFGPTWGSTPAPKSGHPVQWAQAALAGQQPQEGKA
jgi:hypothetical protein